MTISEKLAYIGFDQVRFYKEGVFWVAYEQSAYYVWLQKSYKATRKYMKCLNSDVISIGFPENALKSFESDALSRSVDNPNICILHLDSPIDEQAFIEWRGQVPLQEKAPLNPPVGEKLNTPFGEVGGVSDSDIIEMLRQFPLDRRTPIECMQFVSEMKSKAGL
ncbi:hypothetical protein D0T84_22420 [Dysgonomonas sp. 521]|uniref:hypothetical protein n=1 Tax=Dysgonomonas sp. 521 TaxID=2302932 RepID=UPI0013D448FB|nr:hypothetical protein [Dysgonomonas sp. 521]NDV97614.1 hypothetical protein [Dysgonomonas sp. 521]